MRTLFTSYLVALIAASGLGCQDKASGSPDAHVPFCGDGMCDVDESHGDCPDDCFDTSFLGADGQSAVLGEFSPAAFDHLAGLADEGIAFYGDEKLFWHDFEPEAPVEVLTVTTLRTTMKSSAGWSP